MEEISLGLAFIAGLLSFVSPCVLPLVPAYVGYMGGRMSRNVVLETGGAQSMRASATARAGMLVHGLAFVLGFTVVFVSIGLMTTAFVGVIGASVTLLTTIISRLGGIIIIFFGLHFMGALRALFEWLKKHPAVYSTPLFTVVILLAVIPLLIWGLYVPLVALPIIVGILLTVGMGGGFNQPGKFWLRFMNTIEGALYSDTRREIAAGKSTSLGGSFLMGVIFSAGWTPCIGPLLGTILTIAAQTGDISIALPMLTAYSLGLGIPFLLTAGLLEGAQHILRKVQRHMHKVELASGALLIIIGLLVATGSMASISQNLSPEQIDFSVRVEECGLGFFRGELTFAQTQACLGGSLRPINLDQSLAGKISAESPTISYLVRLEESQVVDVELNRLDAPFAGTFSLLDKDGQVIATSETLTLIEERRYLALQAVEIPAGSYTVLIDGKGVTATFRVRIGAAETVDSGAMQPDTAVDIAGSSVNQITTLAQQVPAPVGLAIGERAPQFSITTIDGQSIQLQDLQGKSVLINFWGTWCAPCRVEMPDLQQVFEQYNGELAIIALAAEPDTEALVRAFQQEMGITFPLAVDRSNRINQIYSIVSQPSTFILDGAGVIRYRHFGVISQQQIVDALAAIRINS
jgi:cytochrome c-type biogenesis protein